MQITEIEEGKFYIIKIMGDVDAASSISLDKTLEQTIIQGKKSILIDCTQLNYIASAGLGVFISYIEDFKEKNIFFAIFGLSEKAKNVFQILGLDKLITIVHTKDDAKKLWKG
ncbi:MAG: STAS domain-containing protein [Microscillaceae bacterium]|jgi:anti-sigma B factor antagonist|nr:STAS domain-containing protein [Microscillaceae bacterium]